MTSNIFIVIWIHLCQSIVQTIISLAFKPEEHAAIFHKGEIHHRVLLTLGVFINLLNKDGQTQRASELALELQSMLGIHGESSLISNILLTFFHYCLFFFFSNIIAVFLDKELFSCYMRESYI